MDYESVQQQRLEERNVRLEEELELLRGVLALVKEDLHVKNDQIEHLYHTFLASREHKRQEQEQRENALKQQVGKLETEIRAKERSFQQLHSSLQKIRIEQNTSRSLAMHESQFHDLPAVLVVNVLSYLDGSDIVCAASMHRNWYIIAMCDSFWKSIYALRWQKVDAKQQGRNFANEFTSKYLNSKTAFPLQVSQAAMDGTLEISTESVEWMTLYRERHIVERNWVNGKATITTLNGHNGTITCLQFNDSRLVSGSDDGSMMLWSLLPRQEESSSSMGMSSPHATAAPALMQQHHRQQKSVEKLHSFYGHGGPVWALHFQENTLISGSYDKTVKIWDLQTGKCQNTLRGHAGWVSSLDSNNALIASASWDSCINVWDLATGTLLRTLQDSPVNPIYSLTWDHFRNAFVTGCKRFGVQVWDVESGLKLGTFIGHDAKNQVNSVKACDERIISGGSDHTVKIWDRRQRACASTLLGHRGSVMCVDYDQNDKVISGSYDSVTKLWDLRRTASALSTFEGHSSAVFSLQMDATKMISGSADTTIKIFRFL